MASYGALAGLFAAQSQAYSQLRPRYPAALYDRILGWAGLAGQGAQRGLAVDLGCGSGQATADLAPLFDRVVGVDAAAEQLRHAPQLPNAEFRCRPVEDTGLPDGCADLAVVATALHWWGPGSGAAWGAAPSRRVAPCLCAALRWVACFARQRLRVRQAGWQRHLGRAARRRHHTHAGLAQV